MIEHDPSATGRRFSMAGRRAFVSGGSVSIGRAIALGFAEAGADVAIQYAAAADQAFDKPDAADETSRAVTGLGRRCVAIEADFAKPGEARRSVEAAAAALGGLDVVVICASIQRRTPFAEVPAEEIDWHIQVNFRATIEILQAAIVPMKAQGYGRILTIGSINEDRPEPDLAVYAALKSAQTNLAINLARDGAPFGVTVNTLAPGLVATERNRWRRVDEAEWGAIQKRTAPMGRAGTPEDMVGAALLLCSEAGAYITGVTLRVNGGANL